MQKAIAYLRFSSDEQADGDSVKRQTANVTRYADRFGLQIEKTLLDEGKSAFKGEHLSVGELGKFLRQAEKGIYRGYAFLVEEQDRLSRQGIRATLDVIGRFLDAGLEIHVTEKSLVIRTEEDLDNLAIVVPTVVNGSTANEYTKKLSERVRSARNAERERARTTGLAVTAKVPAWLKAEVGKKAVLIPDRAKTVHRIFELAGLGFGAKRIVRKLEDEKRAPFAVGKAGQKPWSPEYVQKILRNRSVRGEYQPHKLIKGKREPVGEPIADFFPEVVTQSEWNAARASVEAKTRVQKHGRRGFAGGRHNPNSLLSPLLYDVTNEVKMRYHPGKKGKPAYLESHWQSRKKTHYLPRLDTFETHFLNFLEDLDWQAVANEGESEEVRKAQAEFDATLAELDRCQRKITHLETLAAEEAPPRSVYAALDAETSRRDDLSSRKEKLAARLSEARSRVEALHSPEQLVALIKSGKKPELRLRLKEEIARRVTRIELTFGEDGFDVIADVKFINGAIRGILFKDEQAFLLRGEGQI